jgi:hypothetical protein
MSVIAVKGLFVILLTTAMVSQAGAVCLTPSTTAPGGVLSISPRSFPVAKEFRDSTFVMTAKVMSSRNDVAEDFIRGVFYRIQPIQTFKGKPPSMLSIYTERSSGGFYMDVGQTYLLFAQREGAKYTIDNCGYSDLLSSSRQAIGALKALNGR